MKKNKEALEEFLQTNSSMSSTIRYRKAEQMFQHLEIWKKVDVSWQLWLCNARSAELCAVDGIVLRIGITAHFLQAFVYALVNLCNMFVRRSIRRFVGNVNDWRSTRRTCWFTLLHFSSSFSTFSSLFPPPLFFHLLLSFLFLTSRSFAKLYAGKRSKGHIRGRAVLPAKERERRRSRFEKEEHQNVERHSWFHAGSLAQNDLVWSAKAARR